MDGDGRVRVFARSKPIYPEEARLPPCAVTDSAANVVNVYSELDVAYRSRVSHGSHAEEHSGEIQFANAGTFATHGDARTFNFDAVFGGGSSQSEVFEKVGLPVLRECLAGLNGTILAYGQTGTGKTYSLLNQGRDFEDAGLLPRLVAGLFVHVAQDIAHVYEIEAAALQVYNEQVDDLLHPEHSNGGGHGLLVQTGGIVPMLTWVRCDQPENLLSMFMQARSNLVYAETKMNKASSRSHSVFQVKITKRKRTTEAQEADGVRCMECTIARLNVVDLAGSERVKKSGVEGMHLKEASAINRSLLAFGNVVSALAEKRSFVPFRDSKLTRILDGSIGGNTKTSLLVCVSPTFANLAETVSTLEFASRAMRVEVDAKINVGVIEVSAKALLGDLSSSFDNLLCSSLNTELEHLRKTSSEALQRTEDEVKQWRESAEKAGRKENDLEAELATLRGRSDSEVSALRSEIETQQSLIAKLQEEGTAAKAHVSTLTVQLEKHIEAKEQSSQATAEKEGKLVAEIACLEAALEKEQLAVAATLAEAQSKEETASRCISDLDANVKELQQQLNDAKEILNNREVAASKEAELRSAVADLEAKLEQQIITSETAAVEVKNQLDLSQARVDEMVLEIDGLQKKLELEIEERAASVKALASLQEELEKITQDARVATSNEEKLRVAIVDLEAELQQQKTTDGTAAIEMRNKLDLSEARADGMVQQIDGLQKQLELGIEERAASAQLLASLQEQLEKKTQEVDVAAQVATSNEEELRAEIVDLEAKLQQERITSATAATEMKHQLDLSETRASEMVLEIDGLQKRLKQEIEEKAACAKMLVSLQEQLEKKTKEVQIAAQVAASNEEKLRVDIADLEATLQQEKGTSGTAVIEMKNRLELSETRANGMVLEIDGLQKRLEHEIEERAASAKILASLQEQLEKKTQEVDVVAQVATNQEEELRADIADLEAKLQQQRSTSGTVATEMKNQLELSEARASEMVLEIDALQQRLKFEIEDGAASAKTVSSLQEQLEKKSQEAEATAQVASEKEADLITKIVDLQAKLQKQKSKNDTARNAIQEKLRSTKAYNQELLRVQSEMRNREEEAAARNIELQSKIDALQRELSAEEAEKSTRKEEHLEAERKEQHKIADIQEKHAVELCRIRRDHDDAIDRISELQSEILELRKSLRELVDSPDLCVERSSAFVNVSCERDKALDRICEQQAELDKLRKTTRETVGRTERIARQFELKAEEVADEKVIWQARAEEAQERIKALSAEVERARQENSDLECTTEELKTALDAAEMHWAETEKEATGLRHQMQILKSEVSQIYQRREAAEADLQQKSREIEQWQEHALTCSVRFSSLEDKKEQRRPLPHEGPEESHEEKKEKDSGGFTFYPGSREFRRGRQEGHLAGA